MPTSASKIEESRSVVAACVSDMVDLGLVRDPGASCVPSKVGVALLRHNRNVFDVALECGLFQWFQTTAGAAVSLADDGASTTTIPP